MFRRNVGLFADFVNCEVGGCAGRPVERGRPALTGRGRSPYISPAGGIVLEDIQPSGAPAFRFY